MPYQLHLQDALFLLLREVIDIVCKTCGRLSSSAASFNDHTQIILVLIAAADEICNRGTMGGGFGAIPEILSLTIKSDSRFIQHIYILYLWMELRQILVI